MSVRVERALCAMCFVASCLIGSAASAGDESLDRAKRLFESGDKAEQAGNCEEAVARFRDVLALKETPQVYLRIGRCEDKLGKLSSALESYEKAIALAAGNQAVLDVAKAQLESIDARVPRLTVTVKGPKARVVKVDEVETTALDTPLPLDPGTHKIAAEAPGHEPFTRSVELALGARETVTIELRPIDVAPPPPPPSSLTPWPFVFLGLSGAALVVAIPLAVVGSSSLDETYTHCDPPNADGTRTCPPEYEDEISSVQVQFAVSGAMGALSGLALAGGVTWLIVDLTSTPSADPAPPVAVIPWLSPASGGVVAVGTF